MDTEIAQSPSPPSRLNPNSAAFAFAPQQSMGDMNRRTEEAMRLVDQHAFHQLQQQGFHQFQEQLHHSQYPRYPYQPPFQPRPPLPPQPTLPRKPTAPRKPNVTPSMYFPPIPFAEPPSELQSNGLLPAFDPFRPFSSRSSSSALSNPSLSSPHDFDRSTTIAPRPSRKTGKGRIRPPPPAEAEAITYAPWVIMPEGHWAGDRSLPIPPAQPLLTGPSPPPVVSTPLPSMPALAPLPSPIPAPPSTITVPRPSLPPIPITSVVVPVVPIPIPAPAPIPALAPVASAPATILNIPAEVVIAPAARPSTPAVPTAAPTQPSTPKSPHPTLTKSWASLLRSPAGSSPANVAASSTSSPMQNGAFVAVSNEKKSLAEILAGVESALNAPKIIPRGLVNNGNLCFANTILQCLVFSAPFWNLIALIKRYSAGDLTGRTPSLDAMILFLEEFHTTKKVDSIDHSRNGSKSTFSIPSSVATSPAPSTTSSSDAPSTTMAASTSTSIATSDASTSALFTTNLAEWSEPFAPEGVYESLKYNGRFDAMIKGHQEDAEEFLGFFLDTLHDEILLVIDRAEWKLPSGKSFAQASSTGTEDAGADAWLEVGSKGRTAVTRQTETRESPITKIFGGQLRSVLRCPSQKDSITLEPYQRLQLDIQPDNVKTIENALLNLTLPENLPDFVTRSGLRVEATKQVLLETFPPVLILHLKRFLYDNVGGVQKCGKVIGYGLELEIGSEVVAPGMRKGGKVRYQLYGVVYHHGKSAAGGHYTVAVRQHAASNSWYHIDDTHITPISPNEVAVSVSTSSASQFPTYSNAYSNSAYRNSAYEDKGAYLLFYNLIPNQ